MLFCLRQDLNYLEIFQCICVVRHHKNAIHFDMALYADPLLCASIGALVAATELQWTLDIVYRL